MHPFKDIEWKLSDGTRQQQRRWTTWSLCVFQATQVTQYTPQNNLRATSFIFPFIITKMRPASFKIISLAKLEVVALFQSAQHVRNMFSYKSVNGTNNARPKDSKKNGIFQNNDFYPKMKFFHNTGKILCLMKTILSHKIMQIQPSFK